MCVCAALYRWALGEHRAIMWRVKNTNDILLYEGTEQSGEQGTENEEKKKKRESDFSLAAVTYSLRSWVGSALNHPPHKTTQTVIG